MTTQQRAEEFLIKAKQVHNHKYKYNIQEYRSARDKINIICPEHGLFQQRPSDHIHNAHGCPKCGKVAGLIKTRTTDATFLDKLKYINPDISCEPGQYVNCYTKVKVVCKKCNNMWWATPRNLNAGCGCAKCSAIKSRLPQSDLEKIFIKKLEKTNPAIECVIGTYINRKSPVRVRCKACSYEWLCDASYIVSKRFNGCVNCKRIIEEQELPTKKKLSEEQFIIKLAAVNPNTLYTKIGQYKNNYTKVEVSCNICKHVWKAIPSMLVRNNYTGCPKCGIKRIHNKTRHDDNIFIAKLTKCNPTIEYSPGQYINNSTKVNVSCKVCGNRWSTVPGALTRATPSGCPNCGRLKSTKSQAEKEHTFTERLRKIRPTIKCISGTYISRNKPIKVRCIICSHEWIIKASYILEQKCNGCPKCFEESSKNKLAIKYRNRDAEFTKRLYLVNPNIQYDGGEFINLRSRVHVSCKKCGHIWSTQAESLVRSRPRGCAKCAYKSLELTDDTVAARIAKLHPTLTYRKGQYRGKRNRIEVTCTICSHKWSPLASSLLCNNPPSGCPKCALPKYEKIANKLLDKLNILYEFQYIMPEDTAREGCYRFNYDLYIPELKLLIEVDEPHHYVHATSKENIDLQQRDMDKNELAKLHNYHLVRIPVAKGAHPDVVKDPLIHAIVQYGGKFICKGKLYKTALELHKATKLHKDIKEYNKYKLKNVFTNS